MLGSKQGKRCVGGSQGTKIAAKIYVFSSKHEAVVLFVEVCHFTAGHCKKLKPDWDKLMDEFNGSPGSVVADVDCTTEGKSLCEKFEASWHC